MHLASSLTSSAFVFFLLIASSVHFLIESPLGLCQVAKSDVDAALKILNFAIYHKELTDMEEREQEREREQGRKRAADGDNDGPPRGPKSKRG